MGLREIYQLWKQEQSQSKCWDVWMWVSSMKLPFRSARFWWVWWSTLFHNGYLVIKMHPGLESTV